MRLFVYGTLKKDCFNHDYLKNAKFIKLTRTKRTVYDMYDTGDVPAVVEGGNFAIAGELYEIDPQLLSALDHLEENGFIYERKLVEVIGSDEPANMYLFIRAFPMDGKNHIAITQDKDGTLIKTWTHKLSENYVTNFA